MTTFSPDYFIHAANVLLLVAYSVRDILWLRLFAMGASVISIPYFLLQPTVLRAPLVWTVVFAGINLLQSWRLFIERRPVQLSPEEEEVRRLVFGDLPHRKVLQVLSIGSWTTAPAGRDSSCAGRSPTRSCSSSAERCRWRGADKSLGTCMPGNSLARV